MHVVVRYLSVCMPQDPVDDEPAAKIDAKETKSDEPSVQTQVQCGHLGAK